MVSLGQVVEYEDGVNEHSFILSEPRYEIKQYLSHCGILMPMPEFCAKALKVKG